MHKVGSPHPAFPWGWKTQKHLSTTTFVRFLLTTENHLPLPVAKRPIKNKSELSFMKTHFPSLILDVYFQKRIFLWARPDLSGDYVVLNSWENFNINLDENEGGRNPLVNSILTWSSITRTGTTILSSSFLNFSFILTYCSMLSISKGLSEEVVTECLA